jgi:hypothetical protein
MAMLSPEMNGKITDVAHWMDLTKVPPGTEDGHARSAVRAILGLARFTGGDMGRVEEILAKHITQAWQGHWMRAGRGRGDDPTVPQGRDPCRHAPRAGNAESPYLAREKGSD